mmetsp:Transcript_11813/g.46115  ORF Transcript_11813/g.46115 Transcript_11813/m.46115 type:complete len:423 (-) Transcript_11813:468-1736(-)
MCCRGPARSAAAAAAAASGGAAAASGGADGWLRTGSTGRIPRSDRPAVLGRRAASVHPGRPEALLLFVLRCPQLVARRHHEPADEGVVWLGLVGQRGEVGGYGQQGRSARHVFGEEHARVHLGLLLELANLLPVHGGLGSRRGGCAAGRAGPAGGSRARLAGRCFGCGSGGSGASGRSAVRSCRWCCRFGCRSGTRPCRLGPGVGCRACLGVVPQARCCLALDGRPLVAVGLLPSCLVERRRRLAPLRIPLPLARSVAPRQPLRRNEVHHSVKQRPEVVPPPEVLLLVGAHAGVALGATELARVALGAVAADRAIRQSRSSGRRSRERRLRLGLWREVRPGEPVVEEKHLAAGRHVPREAQVAQAGRATGPGEALKACHLAQAWETRVGHHGSADTKVGRLDVAVDPSGAVARFDSVEHLHA